MQLLYIFKISFFLTFYGYVSVHSHVSSSTDISCCARHRWFWLDGNATKPGPAIPQRLPKPSHPDVHTPWLLHSTRLWLPATNVSVTRAQLHQPPTTGTYKIIKTTYVLKFVFQNNWISLKISLLYTSWLITNQSNQ